MAKRDFYLSEDKFDPYQVKIINRRSDGNFIVQGCAGSGKSILALWKAKDILHHNYLHGSRSCSSTCPETGS